MKPSIGRTVHYVSYGTPGGEYGKECRAAIITEIQDDPRASVGLCVLNPAGQFFNRAVPQDEGHHMSPPSASVCGGRHFEGGSWHWPEREPPEDLPGLDPHPLDLSPEQVQEVVRQVQASLLRQAKRGRRPGSGA